MGSCGNDQGGVPMMADTVTGRPTSVGICWTKEEREGKKARDVWGMIKLRD